MKPLKTMHSWKKKKEELKVREDNEVVNAKTKGREVIESNHVYQERLWGA